MHRWNEAGRLPAELLFAGAGSLAPVRRLVIENADCRAWRRQARLLRRACSARRCYMRHVMPELLRFIGNRPLVGYWIAFDASMLNKHVFRLLNIRLPNAQSMSLISIMRENTEMRHRVRQLI